MNEKTQALRIRQHLSKFAELCEMEYWFVIRNINGEHLAAVRQERKLLRALLVGLGVAEADLNFIAFNMKSGQVK